MSNRKLVRDLSISEAEVDKISAELMVETGKNADEVQKEIVKYYADSVKNFTADTIIKGKILQVVGDDVLVDIGYKSEGVVPKNDFVRPEDIVAGKDIEVFLESVEDEAGVIALSKQKADKIRGWERIITSNKEGDVIEGRVVRKIKGGLLVDVGVPVFLPASQVDVRRVEDIGEFLGKTVKAKILKIDEKRMNIIVSRRKLLEEERAEQKSKLLTEINEGDVREGTVKNIADFGAFVDLGGIDGLLHITDMSWGRVTHPTEVVKLEQQIKIKVLKVDRVTERIALGLKQLQDNPWSTTIPMRYAVGNAVSGKITKLVSFGAFVELERDLEGLLHISKMDKEVETAGLAPGDIVEVKVVKLEPAEGKIGLSLNKIIEKSKNPPPPVPPAAPGAAPTA